MTSFALMVKPVKLLAVWPFNAADNGVPSGLKRSTRTVRSPIFVLIKTISVAQPPFVANCGKRTAPAPPIVASPTVIVGTGPLGPERLVIGIVLKFMPRNLNPTTDIGRVLEPEEAIAKVPNTSD